MKIPTVALRIQRYKLPMPFSACTSDDCLFCVGLQRNSWLTEVAFEPRLVEMSANSSLEIDMALFLNVITSVQRTANLRGGEIQGLPNAQVIRGLSGVGSIPSAINEAKVSAEQNDFKKALDTVRLQSNAFESIVSRWVADVSRIASQGRMPGRNQMSMQKIQEVTSARTNMQQATSPASRAFQNLIQALEQAYTIQSREKKLVLTPEQIKEHLSQHGNAILEEIVREHFDMGDKLSVTVDGLSVKIRPRLEKGAYYYFPKKRLIAVYIGPSDQKNPHFVDLSNDQVLDITTSQLVDTIQRGGLWPLTLKCT